MVLTEIRKIHKLSMKELADQISVSKQLIGQIEKGQRTISDDVLEKLVRFFGFDNSITDDFRGFLLKDSMNSFESAKITMLKIQKESEEIIYEETDQETGSRYSTSHHVYDVSGYIEAKYRINKEELIIKLKNRLESIINKTVQEQESVGLGNTSIEQALLTANEKVDFFKKLVDLEEKSDPYIFEMLVRALYFVTNGGIESNKFVKMLAMIIENELERKQQENEE